MKQISTMPKRYQRCCHFNADGGNVASRNSNQPVTKNEQGVALVSGVTPRLFSMVASGELSPYKFMIETISNERYAKIVA